MIDHLVGRPSPSWKRTQVFLVIFFWVWRIGRGTAKPPRVAWLREVNRYLQRFTPWQIIISTLTAVYSIRNFDKILGLHSPEPLARLYTPSYYRATWITTGLDAGFATAMSIRPKWLRDICSILFGAYYILYANKGDEKLRRFRAVPTVEMLRATWEKTTNPYIRMFTHLPYVSIRQKILLPRPEGSQYNRPITAYLFFHPDKGQLCNATDLILDIPGGGFVAMSPEHHEERLRIWAVNTGKPVLSIDYGKAPEYPYPFAIDEAFDAYKVLVDSVGTLIGMSGKKLNVVISGDSAGATLVVNVMIKILEATHRSTVPKPLALVLNYAALDFNFTSWMSAENMRVLRSEQSSGNLQGLEGLVAQKDHLQHTSPLSMVKVNRYDTPHSKPLRKKGSWKDTIRNFTSRHENESGYRSSTNAMARNTLNASTKRIPSRGFPSDQNVVANGESEKDESEHHSHRKRQWRHHRYPHIMTPSIPAQDGSALENQQDKLTEAGTHVVGNGTKTLNEPIGTRLTMTSRTGYFQDRIISPSMMRAMAILYIGPYRNPDFSTDYHISPILTPTHLLAQFPPLLLQCGERDPFVDDTVIFAGRIREAKRARKVELELALAGRHTWFEEYTKINGNIKIPDDTDFSVMSEEREKLESETEDDWVQMVLFSDWSHGYLQMPTLMSEAKAVIEELAEWIVVAFNKNTDVKDGLSPGLKGKETMSYPSGPSGTETDDIGITFAPKKYQNSSASDDESRKISTSAATSVGDTTSNVGMGLERAVTSYSESVGSLSDESGGPGSDGYPPMLPEMGYPSAIRSTPPAAAKQGILWQGGTPITETELMRRRRLLDSHIFV